MQPRFIWKTKKSLCFDKTLRPKTTEPSISTTSHDWITDLNQVKRNKEETLVNSIGILLAMNLMQNFEMPRLWYSTPV